jgi:hypothetical protein
LITLSETTQSDNQNERAIFTASLAIHWLLLTSEQEVENGFNFPILEDIQNESPEERNLVHRLQ